MLMSDSIASIRRDYALASLSEADIDTDPFKQFQKWFSEAVAAAIDDVNAMVLSTVDASNKPHARVVLLKGFENGQFTFFTNYLSHKGQDMKGNPHVSLVFFWKELQRQVRIEGSVQPVSEEESTRYFSSRPVDSQLGAWASQQSQVLESREELESRFLQYKEQYKDASIPKPPHWGGYALTPDLIEFWQGRQNRLHDRFSFSLLDNGHWQRQRLNP